MAPKDEDSSGGNRLAFGVSTAGVNEDAIDMTTLIVKAKGETVFAGREGWFIVTSDTSSGKMHGLLYSDAKDIFTTTVACGEHMIVSADAGGRVLAWRLTSRKPVEVRVLYSHFGPSHVRPSTAFGFQP